ncbi:multicopper oxidase domain-containing protein [Candidatus Amarolinea dominans]|uniref:multicopper oxidase domain-containing protein n=1 Tax=Candidatus Amarolinea dominans TaxID=3140696 RepID=UPI001E0296DA|nr:multicopper oxidase domain-containing protein [Anaerolineae bacterium]MBK7199648.1 multicopper oxidase domain-containing protein [Anaerolineae bacterium]MBK9094196.1 multicopper oxidase domain-containing protein [Anaerolineae bacterium]MBK9234049.1 multicopper oxidase domain-containing protein [Anaerolineae bacterium]
MKSKANGRLSRREFLAASVATSGVAILFAAGVAAQEHTPVADHTGVAAVPAAGMAHGENSGLVGEVNLANFDPTEFLYDFDWGQESVAPDGRTVREWQIAAVDKEIEVAPGVFFPAWTYNGQVPGPTFRCRQGDLLRFRFRNASAHPHTIHFHGIHPPSMDGVTPVVPTGGDFVYEFEAKPFGLHLYHCHVMPLKRHIHKGLYGAFIIDPPAGRPPAREMVMVMNGFDTNFDNENEVYAVNTVAFHYVKHPIQVKVGELIRVYLVNVTEFDPVNSFHLHASMYRLYRTGTNLEQYEYTDNVIMGQGERHVLEFTLEYPGQYMFHAHQSELAELGWMGLFEATA